MDINTAIKNRKTQKVLADRPWPNESNYKEIQRLIDELLELAACAPYHYPSDEKYQNKSNGLTSCLPYRFYVLDRKNCRLTAQFIKENEIHAGKITNMLDAADVLMMVTWLPEPNGSKNEETEAMPFVGNRKNMEHIAAASAAIQNVLIGATAQNIPTYWSSGGKLRKEPMRSFLNISLDEILLGAIFLFPKDSKQRDAFIKPGALRKQGKERDTWAKWIEVDQ